MPGKRIPLSELPPSARRLREARDELKMSSQKFGELLMTSDSHVRGLESGHSHCAQSFIDTCKVAAEKATEEPKASVLRKLVKDLQAIRDEESAQIALGMGNEGGKIHRRQRVGPSALALAGKWVAAWQTLRNHEQAVVLETVEIEESRQRRFKMKNLGDSRWVELELADEEEDEPRHFRWLASCQISVEHWISGHFDSLSRRARVSGSFRLKLDNFPDVMVGNWMGVSADSERTYAILVLAKTEKLALKRFDAERETSPFLPFAPGHPLLMTSTHTG